MYRFIICSRKRQLGKTSQKSKFPRNTWFDQEFKTAKKRKVQSNFRLTQAMLNYNGGFGQKGHTKGIQSIKCQTIAALHMGLKEFKSTFGNFGD